MVLSMLGAGAPALGCPVCFGQSDNAGLGAGLTIGLAILMGFTMLLLGGIFTAVYRIEKRRHSEEGSTGSTGPSAS